MLGYLFKRLCGRARRACERCRPRARAVCRFVRRRFVWVVLICTIGVEFLILDSWLAATVVELLRSGLLTAWFLLVGRLVWRFLQLGAARWQPA